MNCLVCNCKMESPGERVSMMVTCSEMTMSKAGMICAKCKLAIVPFQDVLADAMFDQVVLQMKSIANPKPAAPAPEESAQNAETEENTENTEKTPEQGSARKEPPSPEAKKEVQAKTGEHHKTEQGEHWK